MQTYYIAGKQALVNEKPRGAQAVNLQNLRVLTSAVTLALTLAVTLSLISAAFVWSLIKREMCALPTLIQVQYARLQRYFSSFSHFAAKPVESILQEPCWVSVALRWQILIPPLAEECMHLPADQ